MHIIFFISLLYSCFIIHFSAQDVLEQEPKNSAEKKILKDVNVSATVNPLSVVQKFANGDSIVNFYNSSGVTRRYSDVDVSIVNKDKNVNKCIDDEKVEIVDASHSRKNIKERFNSFLRDFLFLPYFQIRLHNIDENNYEVWVDDNELSNNKNYLYKIPLGEHRIVIRRFGYDDIVFKTNINSESEFDVFCKFKQSPFQCFNLVMSSFDINPRNYLEEEVTISFDVNRNVPGKNVVCEIKNEETGTTVFKKDFSEFKTFTQRFIFNGKDKDGKPLPDGHYFVNVIYDDNVLSTKLCIDGGLAKKRRIRHRFFGYSSQYENAREPILNFSRHGFGLGGNDSAFVTNRFKIALLVSNFRVKKPNVFIVFPLKGCINVMFSTYTCLHSKKVNANIVNGGDAVPKIEDDKQELPARKFKMHCKVKILDSTFFYHQKNLYRTVAIVTRINLPGLKGKLFKKKDTVEDLNISNIKIEGGKIVDYVSLLYDVNLTNNVIFYFDVNMLGIWRHIIKMKDLLKRAFSCGVSISVFELAISLVCHWKYSRGDINEKFKKTLKHNKKVKYTEKWKEEIASAIRWVLPPDNIHFSAMYRWEFYNISVGIDLEFKRSIIPLFSIKIQLG